MTDNFKILSDSSHIRKRFSMYGGSQVVQEETAFINADFQKVNIVGGLLKVINEIIDNSVDEHVRTKANMLHVLMLILLQMEQLQFQTTGAVFPVLK